LKNIDVAAPTLGIYVTFDYGKLQCSDYNILIVTMRGSKKMTNLINAEDVVENDIQDIFRRCNEELNQLSGNTVLFTGGGGFLGYLFLHTLTKVGYKDGRDPIELVVYDNFRRGCPEWLKRLAQERRINLLEHDVSQPLPENKPAFEYIIHAASIASPTYYRAFPIQTIDTHLSGVRQLLDYSRQRAESGNAIKGMLFFSTSEIYGDPSAGEIPTSEDYRGFVSCTGPRACYDESKRLAETLCVNFFQQYNIPVKIVRPFNNYGPGLNINDGRVLPDFAKNIMAGQDLTLYSDGAPTRTFCYISDAITGYIKTLINGRSGEAYNIGTSVPEISIAEFAEKIVSVAHKLFGNHHSIIYRKSDDSEYLADNPSRRCPDISKARTEIGYDPKISLEEGLTRSLLWYRDNRV
jgi:dTDP-glucose 4,6-dehydratase/UDP-glucuronate decarboxylase